MSSPSHRVAQIADQLRAIAANGQHYAANEYERDRASQVMALAAELLAVVDRRDATELERAYRGLIGPQTPRVAADAAIFDEAGRLLLVQRTDLPQWCMPGGAADVGESPSAAAEREAREETGLIVRADRLLAIWDSDVLGFTLPSVGQTYHLQFQCVLVGGALRTTNETVDFRWCTEEEAVALPPFRGHVRQIPAAFRLYRDPSAPAEFH